MFTWLQCYGYSFEFSPVFSDKFAVDDTGVTSLIKRLCDFSSKI